MFGSYLACIQAYDYDKESCSSLITSNLSIMKLLPTFTVLFCAILPILEYFTIRPTLHCP